MTRDSMPSDRPATAPGVEAPVPHLSWQLRSQSDSCRAMGSPLYADLLWRAADDVEEGGPCWEVLSHHVAPGRGGALALRFMAAVHMLVLSGRAPELALHYPSAGGVTDRPGAPVSERSERRDGARPPGAPVSERSERRDGARPPGAPVSERRDGARAPETWEVFRATVAARTEELIGLTALPCQTNEVGRTAALVGGFLEVAARTRAPLRLLEVGASAGLNLRWDRFRYGGGGASWGDPASRVNLTGHWDIPPPDVHAEVTVVERRGCDPRPIDPFSEEGRLGLTASIWADQLARLERLRGALRIAAEVPAVVERASLDAWLSTQLRAPRPGVATVVFHSVVDEYLDADVRERFHAVLAEAGERASADAPLAWLRLEPVSELRSHGVELTTWPGGAHRLVALCGAHGQAVRWVG